MVLLYSIILSKSKEQTFKALPHLSDKERVVIEKNHTAIYVMFMEMIKTMSISSKK
jgi:hypothetical protein